VEYGTSTTWHLQNLVNSLHYAVEFSYFHTSRFNDKIFLKCWTCWKFSQMKILKYWSVASHFAFLFNLCQLNPSSITYCFQHLSILFLCLDWLEMMIIKACCQASSFWPSWHLYLQIFRHKWIQINALFDNNVVIEIIVT
jgi:hypothetical protein